MRSYQNNNEDLLYFNDAQIDVMEVAANTTVVVGGRRIGKSHGMAAPFCLRNTQQMPRSTMGIVGATYQQLLTRTLPGTLGALGRLGFERDKHYFVGKRPPRKANFAKPIYDPPSYHNSIIWYNGTIWRLISQDRPGTSNSLTLDSALMDEAKFLDYNKLKEETFPALGGDSSYFGNYPMYRSKQILSDMPTTKKGSWFTLYKDKMDVDVIDAIRETIMEKFRIEEEARQSGSTPSMRKYYRHLQLQLARLQSVAILYKEVSSIENIAIVGEKYIRDQKRDLPPLIFMTSIMSRKIGKLKDGFYFNLSSALHYYKRFNNSHLDSLDYDFNRLTQEDCRQDADLDPKQSIKIAFDYNSNINWLVAGQRQGQKMYTLKSFFVKYERKLIELVDDFCEYYRTHPTREVVYYYDSTAIATNYALNGDDFSSAIIKAFERHNWEVTPVYIGQPISHLDKYRMINNALMGDTGNDPSSIDDEEQAYLLPLFNEPNNEALLLAMTQTRTRIGSKGIKKDKLGEKLAETEEDKLEYRTDGTDAWDTLFIGMNKFPIETSNSDYLVSSFV